MKKIIFLLCLLFAGTATCFAQTESIYLEPHLTHYTPGFDIYGEPGTVCTLFFWGTYPSGGSGSKTFTLDESGHYRKDAILNETHIGSYYSGFRSYRIDVPEGKITSLLNVGNVETFSAALPSLEKVSITGDQTYVSVSGCTKLRHLDCHYGFIKNLYINGCDSLQYLDCSQNYNNLTNIYGLTDCKELQYIDCRYTSLDSLNLSNCKKLKKLFIQNENTYCRNAYGNEVYVSGLRKLDVSGCTALDTLDVASRHYDGYDNGSLSSLNISGCTNLKYLDCRYNPLDSLNASGLPNLQELYIPNCEYDETWYNGFGLKVLDVSGCSSLTALDCSGGIAITSGGFRHYGNLSSLNIDSCPNLKTVLCYNNPPLHNLEIKGCPNLEVLNCGSNTSLYHLNASGLKNLKTLILPEGTLVDLNVSGCTSLDSLNCSSSDRIGNLKSLNVNGCTNLQYLGCRNNPLKSLHLTGLPNLKTIDLTRTYSCDSAMHRLEIDSCESLHSIDCRSTRLEYLSVSGCSNLQTLYCNDNLLTDINVHDCPNLGLLNCRYNQLQDLKSVTCPNLQELTCSHNQLHSLELQNYPDLKKLDCRNNPLRTLDASKLIKLNRLYISDSIQNLDISNCSSIDTLDCSYSALADLNASGCTSLKLLDCRNTPLEKINVGGLENLTTLYVHYNVGKKLKELDVSNCKNLQYLDCSNTNLKKLDLSNCKNLRYLDCSHDSLTSIDVSAYDSLRTLICNDNNLTDLNVRDCKKLYHLDCRNNQLTTLSLSGCSGFTTERGDDYWFGVLDTRQNALPLSECYSLQKGYNWFIFDRYNTDDQHIYISIPCGEVLDLEKELNIGGTETSISGAEEFKDYIIENNKLKFLKSGIYELCLKNERVLYVLEWRQNGLPHRKEYYVYVYYHVTVFNKVEKPKFTPSYDTIAPGKKISISCATTEVRIYVTLDGSEPNPYYSAIYREPFVLDNSATIKAIAIKPGWENSQVATKTYIIKEPDNHDTLAVSPRQPQIALRVYPNPCNGILYIETGQNNELSGEIRAFRLLDLQGREQLCAPGSVHQMDMSPLPSGIYILEAIGTKGATVRHKIVRQ